MLTWQQRAAVEKAVFPQYTDAVFARLRSTLAENLHPRAFVFDAGSGPGTWVLRRHRQEIDVAGLDLFHPDPVPSPCYAIGSLEAVPYADALFDLVLCYDVIEHLEEPVAAFTEFWRVLKPGGLLVLKTPNLRGLTTRISSLVPFAWHVTVQRALGTRESSVFPTLYRCNTALDLNLALQACGFTTEALYTVDESASYCAFTPWTYALGLVYSRWMGHASRSAWRNAIVGVFRKHGAKDQGSGDGNQGLGARG
jgi:SAM-dependent methyltransferase